MCHYQTSQRSGAKKRCSKNHHRAQWTVFGKHSRLGVSVSVCVHAQSACIRKHVPPRPDWLVFAHRYALCCPWHTEGVGSLQEREVHEKALGHPQPATFNTFNTTKICNYYMKAYCIKLLHGDISH